MEKNTHTLEIRGNDYHAFKNNFVKEFNSKGDSLASEKKYKEAILQYEEVLKEDDKFAAAWFNKGLMHKNLLEYDMAYQSFTRALQCDQNHTKAKFFIAGILLEKQDYLQAWQYFKKLDLSSLSKEDQITAMLGIQKCENMIGAKVIFACADLKLSKDGKVKILEFGRGMQSAFEGLTKATQHKVVDLLKETWARLSNVPLLLNSDPGAHFSPRTEIMAYEYKCQNFPPLGPEFIPNDLANYRIVYGGWETQKADERVLVTDEANVDFIFEDKVATHEAFRETDNLDARPKTMLIPRVYQKTLVTNIYEEFQNVKRFVLKAPDYERGEGVHVFDATDLENVLDTVLSNRDEKDISKLISRFFNEKTALDRLADSKSQFFLLEEYIENKPVVYNEKLYDATMRVAFLIIRDKGHIVCEPFACYWKLPPEPIGSPGDLRGKTVSSYSKNRCDAVQVSDEDQLTVYRTLKEILPNVMQHMLISDIPKYIEQKLVEQYKASAWIAYSNSLAYRGEFILAEHFLQKAEELLDENNRLMFHHQQGVVSHLKKDYTKAIHYFDKALKENPRNPSTNFRKGVSYLALGNTGEMEECFKAAGSKYLYKIMQVKSDLISKYSGQNTVWKQDEFFYSSLENKNGVNSSENEKTSTVGFSDATACLFQGMFSKSSQTTKNNEINVLIREYKLKDNSKVELERGLRNAAVKGDLKNIKLILTKELDINAQDDNPERRKTALHWAVIKKHGQVIEYLLKKDAQFNISDADGKTALDYADEGMKKFFKEYEDMPINEMANLNILNG